MYQGLLHQYKEYLPVNENTPALSLAEGNTPLIPLPSLSNELGIQLYGKYEGLNPTGSFKDRGMVMAVAKAVEEGAKAIVYGADIISIPGNFDEALKAVRDIAKTEAVALVNSVNPYRLEGQKTAAFEVCEQLGQAPDVLAIPVGNAGNISAYWKGFKEWHEKKGTTLPRMHGFEAEGAAAIVRGEVIEQPETIATAIRIGNPASWQLAEAARDESNGHIDAVTDEEILNAYRKIAAQDGVFIEPGSAASLAGVIQHVKAGKIKPGETVVAVFTGNGLKDPDTAIKATEVTINKMSDLEEMRQHLREGVAKL